MSTEKIANDSSQYELSFPSEKDEKLNKNTKISSENEAKLLSDILKEEAEEKEREEIMIKETLTREEWEKEEKEKLIEIRAEMEELADNKNVTTKEEEKEEGEKEKKIKIDDLYDNVPDETDWHQRLNKVDQKITEEKIEKQKESEAKFKREVALNEMQKEQKKNERKMWRNYYSK